MKYYAFKSLYGYNPSIREGKILAFSSKETLKYILEINVDLVEIMSVFRIHFREKAIMMNRYLKFRKKYKLPNDLFNRELGLITFRI
jgi:hypothetical protein|tara:strand:+ start:1587 stop:1847 length:261 start_codon:yes stop_codon:yes gene_type:complete